MDGLGMYSSVVVVLSVALLLVLAGVGKHQLVWKRRRSLPMRVRRHR